MNDYLNHMQAHIDEGGKLSHRNALDLLDEVKYLRSVLEEMPECDLEFKTAKQMADWCKWKTKIFTKDGELTVRCADDD
jgi:hypothetical protein